MICPQYIRLTVTRVSRRNPRNPKAAEATIINPPAEQLFILPMMIGKSQRGENAEFENGAGELITVLEHFEDIMCAINDACLATLAIAKPVQRWKLEEAAKRQALDQIADRNVAQLNVSAKELARQAEGAKHQDEAPAWGDFVQTAGEDVGAPADEKRQPQAGDLKICPTLGGDRFWIEVCLKDYDDETGAEILEWSRAAGVPRELMPIYETVEAAREAVKLAGYIRRLIED